MLIEVSQLQDDILLVTYHGIYQPLVFYDAIKPYYETMSIRIIIIDIQQLMFKKEGIAHIQNLDPNHPMMEIIESLEEYAFVISKNHPFRETINKAFTRIDVNEKIKFYNSLEDVLYI